MVIGPHVGPQEQFLASGADIAVFGGAAGGGKSWALLLEPLRHVRGNRDFAAVYFRRTTVQIRNPGGLWDQSMRIYPYLGGRPVQQSLEWRWSGGGRVKLAHLEHEDTKLDWHGSELPLICFDELTHFTASQFWYLMSRNRSISGVRSYVRASCNPDADSWVAGLIGWWIDPHSGLPIPERSGVWRWFVRIDDTLHWADSPAALVKRFPGSEPKSLTFIAATLDDNPTLTRMDPGYRANLMAMPTVERERLLMGNWRIRPSAGLYFNRSWIRVVDIAPRCHTIVRGWDIAATPESPNNDPDWTTGTKIGRLMDGTYIVLDHQYRRGSPNEVERMMRNIASQDGVGVKQAIPQDPGAAGKILVNVMTKMLAGFPVEFSPETGDKITRFSPFSAQAEAGNVLVLRGDWNERWFHNLEGFPELPHDDDCDSTARAFSLVVKSNLDVWLRYGQ